SRPRIIPIADLSARWVVPGYGEDTEHRRRKPRAPGTGHPVNFWADRPAPPSFRAVMPRRGGALPSPRRSRAGYPLGGGRGLGGRFQLRSVAELVRRRVMSPALCKPDFSVGERFLDKLGMTKCRPRRRKQRERIERRNGIVPGQCEADEMLPAQQE